MLCPEFEQPTSAISTSKCAQENNKINMPDDIAQ